MTKGPVCCSGLYSHFIFADRRTRYLPIHIPRVNGFDCLGVLVRTETSAPSSRTERMRRAESAQVPNGRGSGSALPLKQPLRGELQSCKGFLFRLLSKVDFPARAGAAIASCKRSHARGSNGHGTAAAAFEVLMASTHPAAGQPNWAET